MKYFLIFLALSGFVVRAQVDFDNYTTLLSSGEVPEEFTLRTYEKVQADVDNDNNNLSSSDQRAFYTGINYLLDQLIHSGYIIYGDPITEYINDVADKLLAKNKELRKELRFYTLKSNVTNAFSTDQGMVLVTTGLLSQITSEAQLAYILAHEISHYEQHHVVEAFNYNKQNRSHDIDKLSIYSKERELEADRLGLELYSKAGYSKDEIIPTFDVLLYSYLPFDEIQVPDSYLTDFDSLFIPNSLFPSEPYEIKAVEDDDDSKSSHPNIKTRKDQIENEIKDVKKWGADVFKLGEDRFRYVRNIARFETVRNNLHEAEYSKALYSIFLLEKDFPESAFLKRMKAQAWLGLMQYRIDNRMTHVIPRKSDFEGASAKIHHFLKELNREQLLTLSIRNIYSIYKENPDDKEINAIYDRALETLAYTDKFELDDYYDISFQTAYDRKLKEQETPDSLAQSGDSTAVEKKEKGLSKYDRIKNRKTTANGEEVMLVLDSAEFQYFLIPDIVRDSSFLEAFDAYKDEFLEKEKKEEEWRKMSSKERYYAEKEAEKNDPLTHAKIDHLISFEPSVLKFKGNNLDWVASEKMEMNAKESIDIASKEAGISVSHIDRESLKREGTGIFNDRAIVLSYLEQSSQNTDIHSFPVDYSLVNNVIEKYGTSNIMFTAASSMYHHGLDNLGTLYSIMIPPAIFIYFPIRLMSGHNTDITMVILDLKDNSVIGTMSHEVHSNLRPNVFGAHLYDFFQTINSAK